MILRKKDFNYTLPEESIAEFPVEKRGSSKLLVLDRRSKKIEHRNYSDIVDYISPGDVVVINNTKVIKARIFPTVQRTGRQVEVLFLNPQENEGFWDALIGKAKYVNLGDILVIGNSKLLVFDREKDSPYFTVQILKDSIFDICNLYGHVPLPPYIKREDSKDDSERYNTVVADKVGSVAAPTASLNLTEEMLTKLKDKGVEIAFVELRVGWGTFAPVKEENVLKHKMHEEFYKLDEHNASIINNAISNGGKVWAFGTTATRVLETLGNKKRVKAGSGFTDIFIYPGYKWKIVNHLITNFHVPESTLLMLVSSFIQNGMRWQRDPLAGRDLMFKAYYEALAKEYKFLSYGDSMLII